MSQGQSGSLLAPLIFIICLILLPGPAGFFLAILVLIVIDAVLTKRQRREEGTPMPDSRVLKLPDPRFVAKDKPDSDFPQNQPYGEEVYSRPKARTGDPSRYLRKSVESEVEAVDLKEYGDQKPVFSARPATTDSGPEPKRAPRNESSASVLLPFLPYIALAVFFAFASILVNVPTLFYAFAGLFRGTVIIGIAALAVMVVMELGRWPGFSIGAAIAATYLTALVIFTHLPSAELVLAASAAWLATCLLVRLLLKRREKTSSLLFLLAKNGTEFTLVFTAGAVVALALPSLFRHVPLSRVLSWREHLDWVRKLLDKIALKSSVTLALVIGLLILQRAFHRSKISSKLDPLWKTWDTGSDWLKRLGFALTAIFCFSFTGNLHGNVVDNLQTEIKEFDKTYDQLVWDVYLDLSAQLNIHAYSAAWEQLPPEAKQIVQPELDLNKAAESIPLMYFQAETPAPIDKEIFSDDSQRHLDDRELIDHYRCRTLPDYPPRMPDSFSRFQAPQQATRQGVDEARLEAQKIKEARRPPSWMQGFGRESANKFLEFILDSDHLEFIRKITEQYPVAGELLDVVSKSVQERVSSKLEESANRIAEKRMDNPSLTVAGLIEEEVASFGIGLDSGQAVGRIKAKEPALQAREKVVEDAKRRFEKDLVIERNKELAEMRTAENTLKEVHRALGSEIDIEPEEELRDVSLSSLRIIKGRKSTYQAQLDGIVRRSKPLERIELIGIIGQNTYDKIKSAPEKPRPGWDFTVPGQTFEPPPPPKLPDPYHQDYKPAEKPP